MTIHLAHAQSIMYSSKISSPIINTFAEDPNGYIWMGTNYGLNVYNGATFNTFFASSEAGGLNNDDIRTMLFDGQGRLWLGNESGISVMEGKQFRNITASGFSLAYSITEADSFSVIISNRYGLTKINKQTLQAECSLDIDQTMPINKVAVSKELNTVWFSPDNTSKIYITDMQFTHTEELTLPEKMELCSMIVDHCNHVWISVQNGNLFCYDMHTRQLLPLPFDLQSFHHAGTPLFCVCNAEGNVLLGIKGRGMMCYNPISGQAYPVFSEEKLQGDTYAVLFDSHSNVWLSDKENDFQFYAASRIYTTLTPC